MAQIPAILDTVGDVAESAGIPLKKGFQLRLILEELLVNIVHHGFESRPQDPLPDRAPFIQICLDLQPERLHLTLRENGPAFQPADIREPDTQAPLNQRRPGGLGLFMVKQTASRFEVKRIDDENHWLIDLDLSEAS